MYIIQLHIIIVNIMVNMSYFKNTLLIECQPLPPIYPANSKSSIIAA